MATVRAGHLFSRQQLARLALMPGLPARLPAASGIPPGRLAFPLIRRRRLGGIARVGAQLFFQRFDPPGLLLDQLRLPFDLRCVLAQQRPQRLDERLCLLQRLCLRRRLRQVDLHARSIYLTPIRFQFANANNARPG